MRPNSTAVEVGRGPAPATRPQPRRRHAAEVRAATPTRPWGSRRLPRALVAGGRRGLLFRELLRRAEGVPVALEDGETGIVEEVVFPVLGFDFWPVELVVATPSGRRRVSVRRVSRIDVRDPRIVVGVGR